MADSWRRLVFKFNCLPWQMFTLCRHAPGSPEWRVQLQISIDTARRCPHCVDTTLTFPILFKLLPLIGSAFSSVATLAVAKEVHTFLCDLAVALRPTSCTVERNHLVNHCLQVKGNKRSQKEAELESLLANINSEHACIQRHVEKCVYGEEGAITKTQASYTSAN